MTERQRYQRRLEAKRRRKRILHRRCFFLTLFTCLGILLPVLLGNANEPMKASYKAKLADGSWTIDCNDSSRCGAEVGAENPELTALSISMVNAPTGVSGDVAYQVSTANGSWQDPVAAGTETGSTDGSSPLDGVRIWLTKELKNHYDLYYTVLQNGTWTGWACNGSDAGTSGSGDALSGIRIAVVNKGEAAPAVPEPEETAAQIAEELAAAAGPQIDPSKPMVALTFDDGPKTSSTSRILNSLEAVGGRATFFMVGSCVDASANTQECVNRMVQLGCQVANHTYNHTYITSVDLAGLQGELGKTNQAVMDASGVAPVLVRPPGGKTNETALNNLAALGFPAILWSVDTLDWKTRNAQKTIETVLNTVKDGDIVLMHDIYATSADAAEVIIPELVNRGYQLVTVSELAAQRGGMEPGKIYCDFPPVAAQ